MHGKWGKKKRRKKCITYKYIRRNLIASQHFGKDNGSMVCRTKLTNQLGVTAPIESLYNLIETLKSDRPE